MSNSTTPATQALLPVTQSDREFAAKWTSIRGEFDELAEAAARHRQAHPLPGDVGTALAGLEWSEDGYSLRTPHDGDVDGDGRHIVVGGETVITFADSDVGEEYLERIRAALTPSATISDATKRMEQTLGATFQATPSALSGDAGEGRSWPTALTQGLREILGIPNFQCGPMAHAYQKIGEFSGDDGLALEKRAEDEQAFILHKLISFWFEHGDGWREPAIDEIDRAAKLARAAFHKGAGDAEEGEPG